MTSPILSAENVCPSKHSLNQAFFFFLSFCFYIKESSDCLMIFSGMLERFHYYKKKNVCEKSQLDDCSVLIFIQTYTVIRIPQPYFKSGEMQLNLNKENERKPGLMPAQSLFIMLFIIQSVFIHCLYIKVCEWCIVQQVKKITSCHTK